MAKKHGLAESLPQGPQNFAGNPANKPKNQTIGGVQKVQFPPSKKPSNKGQSYGFPQGGSIGKD